MPADHQATAPAARALRAVPLALALFALAACGGLLVYGAGRGIDLTDEIFYIVWARDPEAYALLYQPFGYLLHPLFVAMGGDLVRYRLAGFAVTAIAGAVLGVTLSPVRARRPLFAVQGAAAALTIYFPWIITPSYNSAANAGAMLGIAGIAALLAGQTRWRHGGIFLAAAGLCLAFFAKPPLFVLGAGWIGVLALARLVRDRRLAVSLLLVVPIAVLLIALFLPLAKVPGLVARILASQQALALPNRPAGLPVKLAVDWLAVPIVLSAGALVGAVALALRQRRAATVAGALAVVLALAYLVGCLPDALDGAVPDFLGLALIAAAGGYAALLGPQAAAPRWIVLLLLATPPAVALGTFNNQWAQLNFSMVFPLVALLLLAVADPLRWRQGIALVLVLAAPVAILLLAAASPYSLPDSIFAQRIPVRHPLTGGTIRVDAETAAFLQGAAGKAQGVLLVDLSGTGPGVAAALGARAPVLLWLNPATPSWPDVVWSRLTPAERNSAWFVGPVWPLFAGAQPARWLAAHRARYCRVPLPPMTFWEEPRPLALWRPCAAR